MKFSTRLLVFILSLLFIICLAFQTRIPLSAESSSPIALKQGPGPISSTSFVGVGEKYIYRITWQDQLIGYSKFFVSKRLALAGDIFYKIESMSELKVGMGEIEHLTFASQMTFKKDGLIPNFFKCIQKYGGIKMGVDCLISSNLVAQRNDSPSGSADVLVNLDENHSPYIFINNLWGRLDTMVEHYWLLIKSGKVGRVYAYDPVLQYQGFITIEKDGLQEIQIGSKKVKGIHYKIRDFSDVHSFDIWVDKKTRILKIKDRSGITFEIANKETIDRFKKAPGVDIWKDRVSYSNVFIPNAHKVNWMKIDLQFRGNEIEDCNYKAPGFSQLFSGEKTKDGVSGVFTIKTPPAVVSDSPTFPVVSVFPEEIVPYTKAEIGIESADDLIKNRAMEATWKAQNIWEAGRKISHWIDKNIPHGVALPSAKMTLFNGQGNSESKALLAIALCRAVGIPARRAGGIVFSGGNFIPHYWFEVYTGKSGWAPLDPSSSKSGIMGATHVRLFSRGDVLELKANVLDFKPKPPTRVTYINRELTWPVGEERIYILKKKGKTIGEETARMEEVAVVDDEETYKMSMSSKLKIGGKETSSQAQYWMNPQGLPFRYLMTIAVGDRKESLYFQAKDHFLEQKLTEDKEERILKIPYSRGAYFADSHFVSQWALICGQCDNPTIGKSYSFMVFIPETYSFESVKAQVKRFESVEAGDKIYDAFRVEASKGLVFWLEKKRGHVVKLSFTRQEVDLELISSKFKI